MCSHVRVEFLLSASERKNNANFQQNDGKKDFTIQFNWNEKKSTLIHSNRKCNGTKNDKRDIFVFVCAHLTAYAMHMHTQRERESRRQCTKIWSVFNLFVVFFFYCFRGQSPHWSNKMCLRFLDTLFIWLSLCQLPHESEIYCPKKMAIKIDTAAVCTHTENGRNATTSKTKHVKIHKIAWKIDYFFFVFEQRKVSKSQRVSYCPLWFAALETAFFRTEFNH